MNPIVRLTNILQAAFAIQILAFFSPDIVSAKYVFNELSDS